MEGQTRFFLFPSRDVQELFANYQTNIVELLQREGLDVSREFAPDPAALSDAPEREPVSVIILASAALAAVLTPTINKIISELARKKVLVNETVCIPVEDSQGNVVRDKDGQPVMQWVDRARFVESSQLKQSPSKSTVDGSVKGIKISLEES